MLTTNDLTNISDMFNLRCLNLKSCKISNDIIRIISCHFVNLFCLDISECNNITNTGIIHIAKFTKLRELNLSHTNITLSAKNLQ